MPSSQKKIEDLSHDDGANASAKKSGAKSSAKRTRTPKAENDLKARLTACFDRIADALDEIGDEELSDVIREDAEVISSGLVSITRPFVFLRLPMLAVVAVVEPLLAFRRIGRILVGRAVARREARRQARADYEQEQEFQPVT